MLGHLLLVSWSVLVVLVIDPIEECRLLDVWTAEVESLGLIVADRICFRIVERSGEVLITISRLGLILWLDTIREFVPQGFGLFQQKFVFSLQVLRKTEIKVDKTLEFNDPGKQTYTIRVGERAAEATKIGAVKDISIRHVVCANIFFLVLRERGLLVHTTGKLVSSFTLCSTAKGNDQKAEKRTYRFFRL